MALRMLASSVARIVEHRRRRCAATEGPIVAHIDPCPAGIGLALGQNRHRRVVAVQALGGIVGDADPPIQKEACECLPALEHVVHGLGDVGMARELGALLAHPGLELGDQRSTLGLALCEPLIGVEAVDRTLDIEQHVDAPDGLERDGRDECRRGSIAA